MDRAHIPLAGPLVLYELNEVSWRVVDWYTRERPASNLAALLRSAETFTSVTLDQGELHPWGTWPTLHRSVYNWTHGIRFINQDRSCAAAYPPVWEKLAAAGKKVGVFGSLQSYPPPSDLPFSFYVPDTFAPGPETLPARYSCFQRLNLRQTNEDRAIAKPVKLDASLLLDLLRLLGNGLRMQTVLRLARQLLLEKKDAIHRVRRPMLQAPVAFDVFRHALTRSAPDFCTFFTNHVAGIMHRYWKYAFPEDFGYRLEGEVDRFHRESLVIALDYADEQIGFLKSYVDERNGRLYIASSMGQEAIEREHEDEVVIEDVNRFVKGIGFTRRVGSRMAMHPDYSFDFESEADASDFVRRIEALRRADDRPAFFDIDVAGKTVSCSAGSGTGFGSADDRALYIESASGKTRVPFGELGLGVMQRDVGTGYHQPEGIFIRYGAGVQPDGERRKIETVEIAPIILSDLGVAHAAPKIETPRAAAL